MDSSPFKKLAPEMRNKIYALALTPDSEDQKMDIRNYKADTALLRVCGQIRSEASGIYFSSNKFYYHMCAGDGMTNKLNILPNWVKVIGKKNAALISSLEIEYGLEGYHDHYHITSVRYNPFKPAPQPMRHIGTRGVKTTLVLWRPSNGYLVPAYISATDVSAFRLRFLDVVVNKYGTLPSATFAMEILRAVRFVEEAMDEEAS